MKCSQKQKFMISYYQILCVFNIFVILKNIYCIQGNTQLRVPLKNPIWYVILSISVKISPEFSIKEY